MRLKPIEVSFGQLAVFNSDLQDPFNDWTDAHVRQGFAWRPGSVSFAVLSSSGSIDIEVFVNSPDKFSDTAQRVIAVPLLVNEARLIEISGVSQGQVLEIPAGPYRLTFEHGLTQDGARMWCRLYFVPNEGDQAGAEILRGDLVGASPLLMDAHAALP